MQGAATIAEVSLVGGKASAYVLCEPSAVPGPGRYLLAHDGASDVPLATEVFASEYRPDGFLAAPPVPAAWIPGVRLDIRGPLGQGFALPAGARRVALIAFQTDPAPLLPLISHALRQAASVALVCDRPPTELPLQVEIHPPLALREVCEWSDYAAVHVERRSLDALMTVVLEGRGPIWRGEAQALVRTSMPCGGLADCGVCTVKTKVGPKLACVEGPVFELGDLSLVV